MTAFEKDATFGGYLPLETYRPTLSALPEGIALSCGRACVAAVLRKMVPRRLWVPHYICDSAFIAAVEQDIEVVHYSVDADMLPVGIPGSHSNGDMLLVVDYFGMTGPGLEPILRAWGKRAILDRSQAFFAAPRSDVWNFNSARKFFGVPDGAFLNGPEPIDPPTEANTDLRTDHLILAAWGDQQEGLTGYRANNSLMSTAFKGMSRVTQRILEHADTRSSAAQRMMNFDAVHARLGQLNTFPIPNTLLSAPLYYPFLPATPVAQEHFHKAGIFAARLWPDVLQRKDTPERERDLVTNLIPLPIDQRYSTAEMQHMAWRIEQLS